MIISILAFYACSEYEIKNQQKEEKVTPLGDTALEEVPAPDCEVTLAQAVEIPIVEECTAPEYNIENPWNVEIEWQNTYIFF